VEYVVECEGLRKEFRRTVAVDSIALRVRPGEVFGLIGPDGAGKTTTMRLLTAILPPTSGWARVLGYDVRRDGQAIKERIGYVSQRFSLYGDLTVAENMEFFADLFQVPPELRRQRSARLLAASRMTAFSDRLAQNLSGGMKQKLALACSLVHTPQALFLDEPTTGVDPVSRREFWSILYDLVREGMTLVVSTPYMDEAERCQRIALMHQGRILVCDTPDAVRSRMTAAVIAVEASPQVAARTALKALRGVQSVEAFGEQLHVVADARLGVGDVRGALEAAGVSVSAVAPIEAGLEDVFVSLVGGTGEA
jgi:ABC-2 type transport system ATP-binding protein